MDKFLTPFESEVSERALYTLLALAVVLVFNVRVYIGFDSCAFVDLALGGDGPVSRKKNIQFLNFL